MQSFAAGGPDVRGQAQLCFQQFTQVEGVTAGFAELSGCSTDSAKT